MCGARRVQTSLVGEVPVDGQALHPGALGDGADSRREWSDRQVELDRSFDDPPSRLGLALGAFPQSVWSRGLVCRGPPCGFQ
jgi:hypothetical protein